MTLTLTPDAEARLRSVSAQRWTLLEDYKAQIQAAHKARNNKSVLC
jgi:hypothetical protein